MTKEEVPETGAAGRPLTEKQSVVPQSNRPKLSAPPVRLLIFEATYVSFYRLQTDPARSQIY